MLRISNIQSLFYRVLLCMVFISGCSGGGGGGGSATLNPCPDNVPALGPTNGEGGLLFFTGCGLWAVDPEKPTEPGEIEAKPISGTIQRFIGGTWDVAAQDITHKHLHSIIYAKAEVDAGGETVGHFYRVNALKSESHTPIRVSSENNAHLMCGVIAVLEDYANLNDSLYVYSMPGPDNDCGLSDDNIERFIRLGDGESIAPTDLPPARDVFTISDLVDKNTGKIIGWLSIKPRNNVLSLPPYSATTGKDNEGQDVLKPPYPLGFFTGTAIRVSGEGALGGLDPNTTYLLDRNKPPLVDLQCKKGVEGKTEITKFDKEVIDPSSDVHLFNLKLKKQVKKICLDDDDGTVLTLNLNASRQELLDQLKGKKILYRPQKPGSTRLLPVTELVLEEVHFASGDPVTINRVSNYIALHHCDIDLTDCGTPIKETTFKTFCAEGGFDQVKTEGQSTDPDKPFVLGAYDHFNAPVSGEPTQWDRQDDDDNDEEDRFTTDGSGHVYVNAQMGDNDTKTGWNVWQAEISGIGSPILFPTQKPLEPGQEPRDFTPPSCKRREEFFMTSVFPQPTRNSKAIFSGKMVVRFDLLYKPDWANSDKEKADKTGSQGVLYVYDIESKTLSVDVPYKTNDLSLGNLINMNMLKYISAHEISGGDRTAFPDGMNFVYDADQFFFGDHGDLYSLPLGNGKASHMASEGARHFTDMKLSAGHLAYTLIDTNATPQISAVKSIPKIGGTKVSLHPDTAKAVLDLVTDQKWNYVYFQTLESVPGTVPNDPRGPGVYSQIYAGRADGSIPVKETEFATLSGRTSTRVLSIVGCSDQGLFTCKNGTLVSSLGADSSAHLSLGTVPNDIDGLFFSGIGEDLLGDGFVDSDIDNVDIFHIRGDVEGSLRRSVTTSLVAEEVF